MICAQNVINVCQPVGHSEQKPWKLCKKGSAYCGPDHLLLINNIIVNEELLKIKTFSKTQIETSNFSQIVDYNM